MNKNRYIIDEYTCVHFIADLKEELEKNGVSSILLDGFSNKQGYHRWIAIEIEPITGQILKPNEYQTLLLSKNK